MSTLSQRASLWPSGVFRQTTSPSLATTSRDRHVQSADAGEALTTRPIPISAHFNALMAQTYHCPPNNASLRYIFRLVAKLDPDRDMVGRLFPGPDMLVYPDGLKPV